MSDKQIWVRRSVGDRNEYALLASAEERDRFGPFGWVETTDEPAPDAWVWMRHDGIDGAQAFPIASVPNWAAKEWYPAAPPEHVDITKDPEPPLSLAALSATSAPAKPAAAGKNPKE